MFYESYLTIDKFRNVCIYIYIDFLIKFNINFTQFFFSFSRRDVCVPIFVHLYFLRRTTLILFSPKIELDTNKIKEPDGFCGFLLITCGKQIVTF